MKLSFYYFIFILLSTTFCIAANGQINYTVKGYGGKHAIIVLSGPQIETLTVSPSMDKKSVRVSGVNIGFTAVGSPKNPDIISSVRFVKRGPNSDLIFNFNSEATVKANPTSSNLQIFIRTTGIMVPQAETEQSTSVDPKNQVNNDKSPWKPVSVPIKFITNPDIKEISEKSPIAIVFPGLLEIPSRLQVTRDLKLIAYSLDLVWSWIGGQELAKLPLPEASGSINYEPQANYELETLVEELTKELVELRESLEKKDAEIKSLKTR